MNRAPAILCTAALTLSACDPDSGGASAAGVSPSAAPTELFHDFGTIRHRDSATHVFEIPMPAGEIDYVPVLYQRNCTCASHRFIIEAADGSTRFPTEQPFSEYAVRDGETLKLSLTVDTSEKEAASVQSIVIPGAAVLQQEVPPFARVRVPVRFSFGIRAPIAVSPAAVIDLGTMPRSVEFTRRYSLRGVEAPVTFGAVRCIERDPNDPTEYRVVPDIRHSLTLNGDESELRVTMLPADERPVGPFAFKLSIETDLPGDYELTLPVSGIVLPTIVLEPMQRLMFGNIDMSRPASQQLLVTDNDVKRSADFVVKRITVDNEPDQASEHFSARLESTPDRPRSRTLVLDYDGGLEGRSYFRGQVELAKSAASDTLKSVEFVAFRKR